MPVWQKKQKRFLLSWMNSGVKWIPVDEIAFWVKEEDMKPVYKKLMEKIFLLGH